MAFVVRAADRTFENLSPDITRAWVLPPGQLSDSRVSIEVLTMAPGAQYSVETGEPELMWIQVLAGNVLIDDANSDRYIITMLARGATAIIKALGEVELFIARVPQALEYDPLLLPDARVRVDWSTEPVLNSEHDSRMRIYLASTGLWKTEAVKGEMIIYPSGAAGAEHHHEGAEHFQFILSGSGTAVLSGEKVTLHPGDLLYNFEMEQHSFFNSTESDLVFVEFFVPGESRTVWPPEVNACGWQPSRIDIKGRVAARELEYHLHGQGDV